MEAGFIHQLLINQEIFWKNSVNSGLELKVSIRSYKPNSVGWNVVPCSVYVERINMPPPPKHACKLCRNPAGADDRSSQGTSMDM